MKTKIMPILMDTRHGHQTMNQGTKSNWSHPRHSESIKKGTRRFLSLCLSGSEVSALLMGEKPTGRLQQTWQYLLEIPKRTIPRVPGLDRSYTRYIKHVKQIKLSKRDSNESKLSIKAHMSTLSPNSKNNIKLTK